MIWVDKQEAAEPDFRTIASAGAELRERHLTSFEAGEPITINDKLYKRYMRYLLTLFAGKCAYCETLISSNQPGDVEHFRPKGRVVGDDLKTVKIEHPTRGEIEHPGYFWLAYEWSNLLPACADCNRRRLHEGEGAGKADRFPVKGRHATRPEDVATEEPWLIDPTRIDPALHIAFHPDGAVSGLTEEGRRTIELFGLNLREGLKEARRDAFRNAERFMITHWNYVVTGFAQRVSEDRAHLEDIKTGRRPYSAMERLAVRAVNARLKEERDKALVGFDD